MRRVSSLVVGVAGLVVLVSAASGAGVTGKSKTAALPGDATTHLVTVKCPKGAKATGGGARLGDDLNDYAQGSYPKRKRGWTAAGYNLTDPATEFTAFARCLEDVKLTTRSKTATVPNDGAAHSVTARCPRGTKVAGGGVEIADDDLLEIGGSYPSGRRGWKAVAEPAGAAGEVTATARCLEDVKLSRRSKSFDMPDDNLTHEVTAKCPKGTKATGGGVELSEPYVDYVQGTYPVGKRRWTAAGFDAEVVTAHVICLE